MVAVGQTRFSQPKEIKNNTFRLHNGSALTNLHICAYCQSNVNLSCQCKVRSINLLFTRQEAVKRVHESVNLTCVFRVS